MVQEKPRLHPFPHLTVLLAELGKEGNRGLLGSELGVEEDLGSEKRNETSSPFRMASGPLTSVAGGN